MAQTNEKKKGQKAPRSYSGETFMVLKFSGAVLCGMGIMVILAVILLMKGDVFKAIRAVCFGTAGMTAVALPVILCWGGILLLNIQKAKTHVRPFLLATVLYLLAAGIAELIVTTGNPRLSLLDFFQRQDSYAISFGDYLQRGYEWNMTISYAGGGAVGMLTAWPLWRLLGAVPAVIVLVAGILMDAAMLLHVKPKRVLDKLKAMSKKHQAKAAERKARKEADRKQWEEEKARQEKLSVKAQPSADPNDVSSDWERFKEPEDREPAIPAKPGPKTAPKAAPKGRAPVGRNDKGYGFSAPDEELRDPYVEQQQTERKHGFLGGLFKGGNKPQPMHIFDHDQDGAQTSREDLSRYQRPRDAASTARTASARPAAASAASVQEERPERQQPAQQRTSASRPITGKVRHVRAVEDEADAVDLRQAESPYAPPKGVQKPKPSWSDDEFDKTTDRPAVRPAADRIGIPVVQGSGRPSQPLNIKDPEGENFGERVRTERQKQPDVPYVYPSRKLLRNPQPRTDISPEEDAVRSRRLQETLASFRVNVRVENVTHGPAISRFEMSLENGINVSKVTNLADNIAMNMEAKSLRIEAPIPGKNLIGIEVPNSTRSTVTFKEVLDSPEMERADTPITVALGKDIAGDPVICNLSKMPHLLIAGATGSGKSVCINTIINSLLYRYPPHEVRLILVDPKVVELQTYNGVPHLLTPVVSDPHKAASVLAWVVAEMMDRYNRFEQEKVRAIDGYNKHHLNDDEYMPRIVVIIDELADLMMTCKKEVEDHICRIAQLARAAGIHLVVATQRPSVNVITGLIKANIPSRIAFKTTSFVDSRTILDRIGAEQLLGWGDMLYAPTGADTPMRVQGCFLSDEEVNSITEQIIENNPQTMYDDAIMQFVESQAEEAAAVANANDSIADNPPAGDGSILEMAIEMAIRDGEVSTSLLQRRLQLGYARAGRIVDKMEKLGVVSAKDGSKPRMTLIGREEFDHMLAEGKLNDI